MIRRPASPASPASTALLLLAGAVLLVGCAPTPIEPAAEGEPLWQAHQQVLNAIGHWQVSGRMAIQAAGEGYHGRFDWRQLGDRMDLTVSGPLSQGSARLRGDGAGVELLDSDGGRVRAGDADTLLRRATGLQVPVTGLRYWILGLPAPTTESSRVLDGQGRLLSLEQNGWNIDYRAYLDMDGRSLPRKVFLERDDLRVRLVVERWRI